MKFSQNLHRNQVPEWGDEYINYKGLKKIIKIASLQVKKGEDADLAAFFFAVDRNLEMVDGFYTKKYSESARRLGLLRDRYRPDQKAPSGLPKDDIEDLIGALLELRSHLRKLQWYGEVNRRGFVKITKKLDKKVQNICAQQRYVASRVDTKPFATNLQAAEDMSAVNTWLSQLGDVKIVDDASSITSSNSVTSDGVHNFITLPRQLLEDIDSAIRRDHVATLGKALTDVQIHEREQSVESQRTNLSLLQRAISCRSRRCISLLLEKLPSLEDEQDMNRRNCIHRLVIATCREKSFEANRSSTDQNNGDKWTSIAPAEAPTMQAMSYAQQETDSSNYLQEDDASAQQLVFVLDQLSPTQQEAVVARDALGRIPLHYASQHGFVVLVDILKRRMRAWGMLADYENFDQIKWKDTDGNTPVHLAVFGGHVKSTRTLLERLSPAEHLKWADSNARQPLRSTSLLTIATKANFTSIVKLLIEAGANVNSQDEQGETALHHAASLGSAKCSEALINTPGWNKIDLNIQDFTFGWTALTTASADGHLPVAEVLVAAGANVGKIDYSGWTAKEHAALRGNLEICSLLARHSPIPASPVIEPQAGTSTSALKTPLRKNSGLGAASKDDLSSKAPPAPVKSFGHRYLDKETMVLVSLGSMDQRKNVKPVQLDNIPLADAHATQLDTALSVVISAQGASGDSSIIDLPVQESISTEPIGFMTQDVTKVKVTFDIVPTYSGSNDNVVGRGVALLSSIRPTIGSKRMNLQGDISVPIVAAKTLDIIGTVNFNFLIITPFSHPNMSINETSTYWKTMTSPMVIGHRGLGKNMASRKSLQLGENTIESFIAAANLGASYVEFDVQLTKDHVPVIYHDFLVSETGIDAPVHALTLEQFLHVSESRTPRSSRPTSPNDIDTTQRPQHPGHRLQRANSLNSIAELRGPDMSRRMKHTRDFKMKGYKGNSRGNSIQSPFTTLEQMFKKLPEHVGFNIEMKYPMLFESEAEEMDTYAVELNSFVDTVLTKVYDLSKKRDIIFSSFNPDICLLLSFKQPSIPIMFLTDAGTAPAGDIRATSLQEAIRFASRWNLLGIVSAAEPLVSCPRLVRVVKESGLVCVSYGTLNNDPANVRMQFKEGIDAVIVDSVLAVRKGLTHGDSHESQTLPNGGSKDTNGTTNDVIVNGVAISAHTHGAVV
ncbi:MAG: Glycerophosphocholine phosphodiesterase [Chrysothrix sp. TS-e1954]|nr:MAG: Glycerophosphocholine phosphodiesterase [Chrysothrix sp. TS-e1954]